MQALGYSKSDIVNEFYKKEIFIFDQNLNKWKTKFDPENYKAKNFTEEIIDAKNNKTLIKMGEEINFLIAKKLEKEGLKEILVSNSALYGKFLHEDIKVGKETFKIGTELNETIVNKIIEENIKEINVSKTNSISKGLIYFKLYLTIKMRVKTMQLLKFIKF